MSERSNKIIDERIVDHVWASNRTRNVSLLFVFLNPRFTHHGKSASNEGHINAELARQLADLLTLLFDPAIRFMVLTIILPSPV